MLNTSPLMQDERIQRDNEYWPNETLLSYFNEHANSYPQKLAVIGPRKEMTYGELETTSNIMGAQLRNYGVERGDVVTVQLPNWVEFLVIRIALLKIGAILNPIPISFRAKNVQPIINTTESVAYIYPSSYNNFNFENMFLQNIEYSGLEFIISPNGSMSEPREYKYEFTNLLNGSSDLELNPLAPNDLSIIPFTSGTTGKPKGIMWTENVIMYPVMKWCNSFNFQSGSKVLVPLPIGHGAGLAWSTYIPIYAGGSAILVDQWSGSKGLSVIQDQEITHSYLIPTYLYDMIDVDDASSYDVSSLENICVGGASIRSKLIEESSDVFECPICRGWGQAEAGLVCFTTPSDPREKRITTDGRPIAGTDIKIHNTDNEYEENEGKLLVRGAGLFAGFYNNIHETEDKLLDGWYITGDVGVIDDEGYLKITGREKDIVMRGGETIPITKIEELLYNHPNVARVAIVGMPDERLGERACAFVETVPGKSFIFKDMIDYLDTIEITHQYYPEHLQLVDEIPVSNTGKIKRNILREDISSKLE